MSKLNQVPTVLLTITLVCIMASIVPAMMPISVMTENSKSVNLTYEAHLTVYMKYAGTNEWVFVSHHPAVLTTIGKNWIEDQLGDSPSTTPAIYISVSSSTSSPSAAWTQIPSEISTNGLSRALATYASTGDGTWTETKDFLASGDITDAQLSGIQYGVSGDNNLLASDVFTPTTVHSGDTLRLIWSESVS